MTAPAGVFIHPLALVESDEIGQGTRVWAFAQIMKGARIGKQVNIGGHSFIESGVRVGDGVTIKNHVLLWNGVTLADYVFVGPNVVFTNDLYPRSPRFPEISSRYEREENWLVPTQVETGASIGANATIVCGVTLGAFCMVAAGSVVTRSVGPHRLVAGNPARPVACVDRQGNVLRENGEGWINPRTGTVYVFHQDSLIERSR